MLLGFQFILLGVIASATLTWLNLPYQAIFLLEAFLVGFSFNDTLKTLQRLLSWALILLLMGETLTQYALYIYSLTVELEPQQKYEKEVQGLLFNTTSFVVFGMKILLIIVQCSFLQFQNHLSRLDFVDEARHVVMSVCTKSFSFFAKLMAPVSQFLYCLVAIVFSLMHPSALFVPLVPVMILAFFTDTKKSPACSVFSIAKSFFLISAIAFTVTLYLYQLYSLQKNDSHLTQEPEVSSAVTTGYSWEVLGLSELQENKQSLAMRTLFPFHYEILFILLLATCSKYADVRTDLLQRQAERQKNKLEKAQTTLDEVLQEDGFSSAASETQELKSRSKLPSKSQQQVEEEDMTMRGCFYRFFNVCYSAIRKVVRVGLDFATVHSTKFALSVLFLVSVTDPNIINGLLFVIFGVLAMSKNTQMLTLWRFAVFFISLLLCSMYGLRVFAPQDWLAAVKSHQKNHVLCLSGLLVCEDDLSESESFGNLEYANLKLYIPYCTLLVTFVLAHYILTSTKYIKLTEQTIA